MENKSSFPTADAGELLTLPAFQTPGCYEADLFTLIVGGEGLNHIADGIKDAI